MSTKARSDSTSKRSTSTTLPHPRTRMMLNVGNPEQALKLSLLPSDGVGLARMEFIFAELGRRAPARAHALRHAGREDRAPRSIA